MALGSAGLSGTGGALDKYVPEVWSKRAQLAFDVNMVAKKYALDLTELLSYQGGDSIHVPKLANRTASTRSLTAFTQVTPVGATENEFTMDVQTWVHDPEAVSDALAPQTKLFMLSQMEGKMNDAVMRKFDTDILALYSTLTTTAQGTDDGATTPSPDNFFSALETLDTNKVPKTGRVIILGPKTYWDLVRNNVISSRDFVTEPSKETGNLPNIGGVPVIMSSNVPDTANGSEANQVLHSEAYAFAIAQPIRVRNQPQLDWLQTIYVADMIYGAKVYRADSGVTVYGR
jgi:hypothetical protein